MLSVHSNVNVYRGETWKFEKYPNGFEGMKFIQSELAYGCNSSQNFLSFKLDRPGVVYIAYIPSGRTTLPWLLGFARHSGELRVQGLREEWAIRYKPYTSAGFVALPGPTYQSGSKYPYLVFIGACEIAGFVPEVKPPDAELDPGQWIW